MTNNEKRFPRERSVVLESVSKISTGVKKKRHIGIFKAKTHLSAILKDVQNTEYVITVKDTPIAVLVPYTRHDKSENNNTLLENKIHKPLSHVNVKQKDTSCGNKKEPFF